ncbi:PepSY domain-containing protein [Neisseria sp.]|uniref:PepSY domain-containing protein n=1 Tax=Neisseria sp. TaxID=192066 RepID=UPI0026DB5C0D|nr:PepSY domain-containing protein [Neisseria sp.]MDO4226495.1 PepSY domain-containing protein [Neisseria sp.]
MKTRFNTLAAAGLASLLAVSGYALADNSQQKIAAVAQTQVTPAQAIAAAQKQAGGQATEIQLKGKYGTPVYHVEVRNGQQEHTVYVDAVSGKVVGSKAETEWKPARKAAVSLERAIQAAQSTVQGRVMEAERDSNRGQLVYKVDILGADNVPHKVIVDADSGKVLNSFVDYDD